MIFSRQFLDNLIEKYGNRENSQIIDLNNFKKTMKSIKSDLNTSILGESENESESENETESQTNFDSVEKSIQRVAKLYLFKSKLEDNLDKIEKRNSVHNTSRNLIRKSTKILNKKSVSMFLTENKPIIAERPNHSMPNIKLKK